MPFPPKKRRRPYLQRQAKRYRWAPPPPPPSTVPTTPSSVSQTSPPPTPPPVPHYPLFPSLQTLPEDLFHRIITILQNGTHLRGKVFQTARHAFPLALVSTTILNRYKASLHTIDAAASSDRDPASPALLREHLPPHIRNLVTIAGCYLRTLRLPRYEHSQIGVEAVLPVIHHSTNLNHLSFVDGGRVDKDLTKSIFGPSLHVVSIEKPSRRVVQSLATCTASLRDVQLSYIPFAAMEHVIELLRSRGQSIKRLSLRFDGRSMQVMDDSAEKSCETSTMAELRRFLRLLDANLVDWLPRLEQIQVTCSDERDLEHARICADEILQRGLGEVTTAVNTLRNISDGDSVPLGLCVISLCGRSLKAIPRLLKTAEIRVRLPGYEFRYHGREEQVAKPCLWHLQMTTSVARFDIPDLWRLTGGIDTLSIGDVEMVRSYDTVKDQVKPMIRNARNLRRVIVRLALSETEIALKVMKYVRDILTAAPWVKELEISHEIVLYHSRREFADMIQAMHVLRVLHLNAPTECLRGCTKWRMMGFVKHLPGVLRRLATFCKTRLEVLYCERIGEARVFSSNKIREEVIKKLGEIDVVIDGRFSKVDCTSLKALVVAWVEQIKRR